MCMCIIFFYFIYHANHLLTLTIHLGLLIPETNHLKCEFGDHERGPAVTSVPLLPLLFVSPSVSVGPPLPPHSFDGLKLK